MSALPLALTRAHATERWRDLGILLPLVVWLVYTRVYWILQASHISAPLCPFYYFTGHPCPFCGGTRAFAYMWEGDISDAVRLYPLGPALFAGALLGAGGLAAGLVTGRTWSPRLTSREWTLLTIGGGSALVISWALKGFVLGN